MRRFLEHDLSVHHTERPPGRGCYRCLMLRPLDGRKRWKHGEERERPYAFDVPVGPGEGSGAQRHLMESRNIEPCKSGNDLRLASLCLLDGVIPQVVEPTVSAALEHVQFWF